MELKVDDDDNWNLVIGMEKWMLWKVDGVLVGSVWVLLDEEVCFEFYEIFVTELKSLFLN